MKKKKNQRRISKIGNLHILLNGLTDRLRFLEDRHNLLLDRFDYLNSNLINEILKNIKNKY